MTTVIDISKVTNRNDDGSFDLLISELKDHLVTERVAGRITGQEYTNAYVQLMTAALQQSLSFELQRQQSAASTDLTLAQANQVLVQNTQIAAETARINAQTALLAEQKANETKQGLLLDQGLVKGANDLLLQQKELVLQDKQILIQESQLLLMDSQIRMQAKELELKGKQVEMATQELALKAQELTLKGHEITLAIREITLREKQTEQLADDILKTRAEVLILGKQLLVLDKDLLKADEEIAKLQADVSLMAKQETLIDSQILGQTKQNLRTDEEILFTKAKTFTEQANIKDLVDGATVTGILGKQKDLLTAQTVGFKRNADISLAGKAMEVFSIMRTTDPDSETPDLYGMSPTIIGQIVNTARGL